MNRRDLASLLLVVVCIVVLVLWCATGIVVFSCLTASTGPGAVVGFTILFLAWILVTIIAVVVVLILLFS